MPFNFRCEWVQETTFSPLDMVTWMNLGWVIHISHIQNQCHTNTISWELENWQWTFWKVTSRGCGGSAGEDYIDRYLGQLLNKTKLYLRKKCKLCLDKSKPSEILQRFWDNSLCQRYPAPDIGPQLASDWKTRWLKLQFDVFSWCETFFVFRDYFVYVLLLVKADFAQTLHTNTTLQPN